MERLQPAKRVRIDKDTMIPWVEPRDKREITIAEIWQEILHLTGVSVYDDFFTLGGHSLLATQVISSLRDAFHVKLSLQEFFARPTIAALALYIKEKDGEEEDIRPALIPTPRTSSFYALSFAQQRLWFVHALDPDSTAYTIPEAIHLNGHLDVHALQQSLSEIVQRHEILRTTFVSVEGQTFQRVSPPSELRLPIIDLRSNEERIGETQRLIREYIQQPFDLTEGPLLRAYLFLLAEEEHVLFICLHHIITDGWSMEVFEQELVDTYTAYHSGQKPHLAALPIQYIDYALWQRAWLKDRVLEQQLTYWKQKLAGIPPLLSLPTDEPRPARQTFRGAHQTMQLPADLSEEISRFCQKEHVTVYMLALAAFTTLLYRLSGQEDIVVGSAIANRDDTLTWNMIGFFANTLILRTDLAGNPQVRDLLSRVKETTLQAYDHQDLPFERLVSELHPERNLRYNPLFQVMFVFQNAPASTRDLPELTWKNFDFASETTRFDLSFHFWETSDGVKGRLMYATDLFYSSTIASFLKRFEVLLAAMVRHPEMPIAHIPLLSPDEQQQLQPAGGIGETAMPSYVKSLLREKIRMLRSGGNNEFA